MELILVMWLITIARPLIHLTTFTHLFEYWRVLF